jgi:hypothetical protein
LPVDGQAADGIDAGNDFAFLIGCHGHLSRLTGHPSAPDFWNAEYHPDNIDATLSSG